MWIWIRIQNKDPDPYSIHFGSGSLREIRSMPKVLNQPTILQHILAAWLNSLCWNNIYVCTYSKIPAASKEKKFIYEWSLKMEPGCKAQPVGKMKSRSELRWMAGWPPAVWYALCTPQSINQIGRHGVHRLIKARWAKPCRHYLQTNLLLLF